MTRALDRIARAAALAAALACGALARAPAHAPAPAYATGLQDPPEGPPPVQEPPRQEPPPEPAQEAPPAQDPAPTPEPAPPTPPMLDFTAPFGLASFEAALGRIAESFPDLLRIRSLGKSRGGREIWLAVACDAAAGDPRRLPAAVVLTDLAPTPAGTAGPEATLFALESLLVRARSDPALRERLSRCALYFVPAPDPDLAFGSGPTGAEGAPASEPLRQCRLDQNFPARWEPFRADGDGGRSGRSPGPYPLSEPETRMLARFLLERENLSTAILMTRARGPVEKGEGGDGNGEHGSRPTPEAEPGSLVAYCREVLDIALIEPRAWTGEFVDSAIGRAPAGFAAAERAVEEVLGGLPHVECGPAKLERLQPDLWMVDLPLRNSGLLPSLPNESRQHGSASVWMKVRGGRVVACAIKESEIESHRAVRVGSEVAPIGHLDGLERIEVRLVVQAEEGAEMEVSFESPRAGSAVARATLR